MAFLDRVEQDDMAGMIHMRRQMAEALDVPLAQVEAAIEASQQAKWARVDAEWRLHFRAHAVLTTTNQIPSPIFASVMSGSEKKLTMVPSADLPEVAWPAWICDRLPEGLAGFGRVTGFVINYTPDHAVRFDLNGTPVETLDAAYRSGSSWLRGLSPAILGDRT